MLEDSEGDYETEYEEYISLEADAKYFEEEDNKVRRLTDRVRLPSKSWQHLQSKAEKKE